MSKYDYLIVGAGWFGAVFAHKMRIAGGRCLVIDRRHHIGGNCFTENVQGIHVHRYGPHIFHTNSQIIWEYVNRFATFASYVYRGKARHGERTYSFPINLQTLQELWGAQSQAEAEQKLAEVRIPIANPQNLEEWALSQLGEELYRLFIYGYTRKQWQREPRDLPASILKRLPIRTTWDDNYYNDRFQGIPQGGYTPIFEKLLDGIEVRLGVDYLADRHCLDCLAHKIVYTGRIDQLFGYRYGELDYRTLRFETRAFDQPDFQGTAVINYTDEKVAFTRIIEHKHFENRRQPRTVVTWEHPQAWSKGAEPFYPINDLRNQEIYEKYLAIARQTPNLILGGRLACYRYYDMHQVIGSALVRAKEELASRTRQIGTAEFADRSSNISERFRPPLRRPVATSSADNLQ